MASSEMIARSDLNPSQDYQFTYTFGNFFHPFVGELIAQLNKESLPGMLDPTFHDGLKEKHNPDIKNENADDFFFNNFGYEQPLENAVSAALFKFPLVVVKGFPKEIDVSACGPYANYNWELFFHIPLTIAVHLSKNQRFAEAQRWFHYIFNPISNEPTQDPLKRVWKFLAFRERGKFMTIDEIVEILSTPDTDQPNTDQCQKDSIFQGYQAILAHPFQPHCVARTRHLAYQYCVVMKYLDNLIAWGDHLYQQDTVESINEAFLRYVLAANVLGERPQRIPPRGSVKAKTYAQLRQAGLGPIGNAFVELEGHFPIKLTNTGGNGTGEPSPLFGIGRTLYFCIPPNEKLLGYWDTVADRLFKIRHCMNIQGVVRPLALFDPPIDPGMLVKAVAAGIDIGSIVHGLNQPISPVRSLFLIQKALELCGEVRNLGNSLLSALEKGDAEHLALVRQRHEIQIQQMAQEVRFLQWKQAQEATTSLLTSRATALERFHYYQRLLGLPADPNAPDTLTLDHRELTEENFDEAYSSLVGQYDKAQTLQKFPRLKLAGDTSPSQQSGALGKGQLYLNSNEDKELNEHMPESKKYQDLARASDMIVSALYYIPNFNVKMAYWGLGSAMRGGVAGGEFLGHAGQVISNMLRGYAESYAHDGTVSAKTASYERRADEWLLQYNLAAHELKQIGRQILTSLIAEQIAHHEYLNIKQQIANAQEVDQFLHDKFTDEDLYLWMQGEISRLYYEYYRFAFDTARKAEKTMKQELMRPEVDAQDLVKFNYWDGGRKGLLSGEALYLDVKRMEMAYHDNNKRELELTKHVSLRQLNPIALLTLKATGTCQLTIPEWLYDLDCPGHYMRRIKNVALSIPSVAGPYTSVSCTLSLLRSSLRKSPLPKDGGYGRDPSGSDDRFVDYIGAVQSIVTSTGQNDSGMFETNLRDERFLPFEGAGAESTWKLDLPQDYRAFDYDTISDVIIHIRYTARQGVIVEHVKSFLKDLFEDAKKSNLALLFSLRHDFPTEWSAFVNSTSNASFTATIRKDYFPYFVQGKSITITGIEIYDGQNVAKHHPVNKQEDWDSYTENLGDEAKQVFAIPIGEDPAGPTQVLTRKADAEVFLVIHYTIE